MRFDDKVAVVVGAGGGLGSAISVSFAERGANVALVDSNQEVIDPTLKQIEQDSEETRGSGGAIGIVSDASNKASVKHGMSLVLEKFHRIDILVNATWEHRFGLVEEIEEDDWDHDLTMNLKAAFFAIQAVAEHMKEREYGRIINLSSTAKDGVPWFAHRGHSAHAAARGGIIGFSRALAYELGPFEITVNAVVAGPILHRRSEKVFEKLREDPSVRVFPTEMMALRRFGEPEDVANAVLFFASDESKYITGSSLYVSGGLYG